MFKHNTLTYLTTVLTVMYLVYHFENSVNNINSEIREKSAVIANLESDIRVFEAEWSHQNNPERLSRMVDKIHFDNPMQSPKKLQYTNIDDIRNRDVMFAKRDE